MKKLLVSLAIATLPLTGLAAYSARDWAKAGAAFGRILEIDPADGPAAIYRDRARAYAKKPPPDDWDGVWTMTEK